MKIKQSFRKIVRYSEATFQWSYINPDPLGNINQKNFKRRVIKVAKFL
jgi:hypothetical protein